MKNNPRLSIAIPVYDMKFSASFIKRLMQSLEMQTFQDFEIIITSDGKMAENTNSAIKKCKGEIIKIMFMDDYLAHKDSLKNIVDGFKGGWLATGCLHNPNGGEELFNPHPPSFHGIFDNQNTIGSPSVIAFENKDPLLFDENMSWVLDIDYYRRLYDRYGAPTLLDTMDVVIGVGEHQATHILTDEYKSSEHNYLNKKYENNTSL